MQNLECFLLPAPRCASLKRSNLVSVHRIVGDLSVPRFPTWLIENSLKTRTMTLISKKILDVGTDLWWYLMMWHPWNTAFKAVVLNPRLENSSSKANCSAFKSYLRKKSLKNNLENCQQNSFHSYSHKTIYYAPPLNYLKNTITIYP